MVLLIRGHLGLLSNTVLTRHIMLIFVLHRESLGMLSYKAAMLRSDSTRLSARSVLSTKTYFIGRPRDIERRHCLSKGVLCLMRLRCALVRGVSVASSLFMTEQLVSMNCERSWFESGWAYLYISSVYVYAFIMPACASYLDQDHLNI